MRRLATYRRDMPILPEGTRIVSGNESYVIGSEIARGGLGVVYAATLDGHYYALKIAVGDLPIKKLAHEAEITAILSRFNAGVLPIRIMSSPEIRMGEGQLRAPFGESEFSIGIIRNMSEAGMLLSDILQENNPDLVWSIDLMMTLTRTLEPIHEQEGFGYIHGDISPENIIVVPSLEMACFIDFGNAQSMDKDGFAEINCENITYNPIFMAPELRTFVNGANGAANQKRSSIRLSKASDTYSLGMIFYALLFEIPNLETCEHIAVLVRNRIQAHFGAGLQGKAVVRLLQDFFGECLSPDEQSRIPDTISLRERLAEIRDVALGLAVTKSGLQAQSEERHVFDSGAGIAEIPDAIRFRKWMSGADKKPLFVHGIRSTGKTVLLKSVCADILEQGHMVPLLVDAEELPDTNESEALLRSIAQVIFRRLFGGFGLLRAERDAVAALVRLLGFDDSSQCSGGDAEYLLVIDNMHILTGRVQMLGDLAKALPGIAKTQFVFCGKAPPEHYENTDFVALFAEENLFHIENSTPHEVQSELRSYNFLAADTEIHEAFMRLETRIALYRDAESLSASALPTTLADDDVYRALDLCHRADMEEHYPSLPALAYSLRCVLPGDYLQPYSDRYSLRRAVWDGILEEIPHSNSENSPEPSHMRFSSSLLADFFAAHYVVKTIICADEPEALFPVNHVWRRSLVRILRALPPGLLGALVNRAEALMSDFAEKAADKADMMPANIFALTGDIKWAVRSLQVADRFFHQEILDGYFAYRSTVFPCDAFAKNGEATEFIDFAGEHLPDAVSKLPNSLRLAVAADLKYGYRLDKNPKLADAMAAYANVSSGGGIENE